MIVILDYGLGNLRSVERAVLKLGYECRIQSDLRGASKVILPGVGAFAKAMELLQPAAAELKSWAASGQPLLGICLGQQLLFESSEELGGAIGLGILPGTVRYLPSDQGLKVPHVGWSKLQVVQPDGLLQGIEPADRVYFVHSLYTDLAQPEQAASWTEYGVRFASAIQAGSIWATQFHPEKSSTVGLKIMGNFLRC